MMEELKNLLGKCGHLRRESSLHLPSSTRSFNNPALTDKKFAPVLDQKKEKDNLEHFVPHFDKINLSNYSKDTPYRYSNRHSESILKILTGEGEGNYLKDSKSGPGDLVSASGLASPAPPSVEDPTFTMDAFWADLGVDAPPPSVKRGDLRQASSFASTECEQENEWDL